MRLFYVSLTVGIVAFVGAVASAFARQWVLAAILLGVFVIYCLVAPRVMKRVPDERLRSQSGSAERLMGAIGRAESVGWTPKRKSGSP
jgi:uncharacterized membrane protein